MSNYTDLEQGRPRTDSTGLHQDSEDVVNDNAAPPVRLTFGPAHPDDRYNPQTKWESLKIDIEVFMNHIGFRIFTLILILVDVIVVIIDLTDAGNREAVEVVTLIIVIYFVCEVNLRLLVKGRKFFNNWVDVFDYVIVMISFIFTLISVALDMEGKAKWAKLIVAGRLIRIVLIVRIITERKHLQQASRLAVSQNKRRYQKDGFDLDLCYVTDRVIAMSFPSKGLMALYRNPIREVARFLDTKHNNHYKIFNLCSERMYDESLFHYRVERIYIDDHNVPKLEDMLRFARVAGDWMEADSENIIAIHCKGGKGRTGTMVATWLIESGQFEQAKDSLEYFGARRTDLSVGKTFQGVQTPSQSRYVEYFEKVKTQYDGQYPPEQKLQLDSIVIKNVEGVGRGDGSDLSFRIITDAKIWEFNIGKQIYCQSSFDRATKNVTVTMDDKPILNSDVKVKFHCTSKVPAGYDHSAFYFWFHTAFIEDNTLELSREYLDNPHKEKTWTTYREGFAVKLNFSKP